MRPANVLIIGGSRGIGAATVRAFVAQGCRVAFTWHTSREAAREVCLQAGSAVCSLCADAAKPADAARAVREAEKFFGGAADVLVYNAGIAQYGLFSDTTDDDWRRMRGVNLDGAVYACRAVLPAMIRQKYGRIILVSSMWGQVGASCEALYSTAKAGLIGLCRALAKEEGPSGITVNCIAPGAVDTAMMAGFTEQEKTDLCADIPAGRLGTAEEIAKTIVFLAGRDSGYINGQVLGQNGGYVV